MNRYEEYLREHPDYVSLVRRIVEYEEEHKGEASHYTEDTEFDAAWRYDEVGASPQKLYQLTIHGFLHKLFDSNSTTV